MVSKCFSIYSNSSSVVAEKELCRLYNTKPSKPQVQLMMLNELYLVWLLFPREDSIKLLLLD